MIVAPLNDGACLNLVLDKAREWSGSKWAAVEAARYRNPAHLARAIRALPQLDDDGGAKASVALPCDYGVRLRRDPRNPNCVERAAWYLAVAEKMDPATMRSLFTATMRAGGGLVRHTNAVEHLGGRWEPVVLQPDAALRNATAGEVLGQVQEVVHPIGAGLLSAFGLGGLADQIGALERQGIQALGGPPAPARPSNQASVDVHTATPTAPARPSNQTSVDVHTATPTAPARRRKKRR
jgi:hypothetical protein